MILEKFRHAIAMAIIVAAPVAIETDSAAAQGADMPVIGWTNPPIGHVAFCRNEPGECARHGGRQSVRLTAQNWHDLVTINTSANQRIRPVTDQEFYKTLEHWTLPQSAGDCEDYALLKRQDLVRRGWPTGALLVAVVFDEIGDGHAVLVVRTDRGEFVLDNRTDEVRRWDRTSYRFVKRQSVTNPRRWVAVSDTRRRATSVSTVRR